MEPSKRLDAVKPVHRHVEEADVGRVLLPEPDCRLAVIGLGHYLKIGLGAEEVREARPHDRMVIDEQQADAGGEVHGGGEQMRRLGTGPSSGCMRRPTLVLDYPRSTGEMPVARWLMDGSGGGVVG